MGFIGVNTACLFFEDPLHNSREQRRTLDNLYTACNAFFLVEAAANVVAYGLVLGPGTYLRRRCVPHLPRARARTPEPPTRVANKTNLPPRIFAFAGSDADDDECMQSNLEPSAPRAAGFRLFGDFSVRC